MNKFPELCDEAKMDDDKNSSKSPIIGLSNLRCLKVVLLYLLASVSVDCNGIQTMSYDLCFRVIANVAV